jgi:peptidoglycan/LPS O-acetylase OafA/YrhL
MTDKKFIPSLTGIRAVCVYFIFFYHLNPFTPGDHPQLHRLFGQFYTFLTFFFVLSGFVICHKYYEIGTLKKTQLYNYFVNRMSRVFPILFILISITFILNYKYGLTNGGETTKLYLLNVSLLKGFSAKYHLTGIGPSWSMSVEELFYALSPLLFLLIKKVSDFVKFVLIFYAAGIAITFLFTAFPFEGFFGDYKFTFYSTFFGRVFEFACGVYLALLVKGKFSNRFLEKAGKLPLYGGILLILLAIAGQYAVASFYDTANAVDTWPGLLLNNLVMPVGITLLFYSLIYHKTLLQTILGSAILVALGNATYSFYLLHTSFAQTFVHKYISQSAIIGFFAMIVIAYIFHKLVEQPLAIFFRRKFSKKIPASTDALMQGNNQAS